LSLEAEYPMVPLSAIATRVVDFIAPVRTLVERIAEVVRSKKAVRQLNDADTKQGLRKITNVLLGSAGHDFSHYSPTELMRQVARHQPFMTH
jgi:two-component system, chemotaxis family, CheB/CheR fusion protein